ncbi:MAG TPA: TetR/AcrR family transcriptional regulator, partial [Streptosporangiaceae bacterium]
MPRTGRRPGSSSTREEITAAAAACFAQAGYDATSLRQVAEKAEVDPALVRRFFGGKEQLFTEVASA